MGQTTTVAENLREPAPIGAVVRPPVEEGSGDQASLKIVLTGGGAAAAQHMVSVDTPERADAPRADRGGPPSRDDDRRLAKADVTRSSARLRSHDDNTWGVQIGAYKKKDQARAALATLEERYAERFGDADHDVQSAGHGYFRARFLGLSANEAKRACSTLRAHHQICVVVSPES
jgi:D-alanyl-D-alanine carboxypeptidase (penicillin-binding protein 5/6)